MKLGFIGTGNIVSDVVTGICKSKIKFKKIIVSPRNKNKAQKLKKKFKKVTIAKNNQEVVDNSDWLFLGVLPEVGKQILPKLRYKNKQIIVSFISTINYAQLKKIVKKKLKIVRAIPMPPIRLGKGPVAIFPPDKQVKGFFNKIGKTIEIRNEKLSLNFWTMSSMMAPYYEILNHLSLWLHKKGLNKIKAENYITSLFLGLSKNAYQNKYKNLNELVKKSQTPKGLNEQGLKEMNKKNVYKSFINTLNSIHKRLNK